MKIGIYGLGEAGSLFAADLQRSGFGDEIHAFDPAPVSTPTGVIRHRDPVVVATDADLLLGVTAASDARTALLQGLDSLPEHAIYADFASSAPMLKRELAALAIQRNRHFCDVALMAIIPGNGIKAPALVAGSGSEKFVSIMQPRGMPVENISTDAGDAAERKLLRSVTMKGLAAVLTESLRAAEVAGCSEWVWQNLCQQFTDLDASTLARLVEGTGVHAARRLHEMQDTRAMLETLGVAPVMTTATVASLEQVLEQGIPEVP